MRCSAMTAMTADCVLNGTLDRVHNAAGAAVYAATAAAIVPIRARSFGGVFVFFLHLRGFGARSEHIKDGGSTIRTSDACGGMEIR